jgi:hypothetical protein
MLWSFPKNKLNILKYSAFVERKANKSFLYHFISDLETTENILKKSF